MFAIVFYFPQRNSPPQRGGLKDMPARCVYGRMWRAGRQVRTTVPDKKPVAHSAIGSSTIGSYIGVSTLNIQEYTIAMGRTLATSLRVGHGSEVVAPVQEVDAELRAENLCRTLLT